MFAYLIDAGLDFVGAPVLKVITDNRPVNCMIESLKMMGILPIREFDILGTTASKQRGGICQETERTESHDSNTQIRKEHPEEQTTSIPQNGIQQHYKRRQGGFRN